MVALLLMFVLVFIVCLLAVAWILIGPRRTAVLVAALIPAWNFRTTTPPILQYLHCSFSGDMEMQMICRHFGRHELCGWNWRIFVCESEWLFNAALTHRFI